MPLVEGENLIYRESLRENNERGVRQSDIEVLVGLHHFYCTRDGGRVELNQLIGSPLHLSQKRYLSFSANSRRQQVVELCEHDWGEQVWGLSCVMRHRPRNS